VTLARIWNRVLRELRNIGLDRILIAGKAVLVIGLFFYPVWWVHIHLVSAQVSHVPLSLAISFVGVQVATILVELMASCLVKALDRVRVRRSARWRPVVGQHIAAYLAGEDRTWALRWLRRLRAADFEASLVEALANVRGEPRERLVDLAVKLGMLRRWQRRARRGRLERKQAIECLSLLPGPESLAALQALLKDPAPSLRATTYRALIRLSSRTELDDVFRAAIRSPLFVRTLLASELRPYAPLLAMHALPNLLSGGEADDVIAALEMVESWRSVIHLPALAGLMEHSNPDIRIRALRLAPWSAARTGLEPLILRAIGHPDPQVKLAGLAAAGRLRLTGATRSIENCANDQDHQVSRAACFVLAALGREGQSILESKIYGADRPVAARAAESLARVRIGGTAALEL
jgi:HEAT repeat protein